MIELSFMELQYWHWWVLGLALLIVEMIVPGTFFLWIGIAAGVVGGLLLIWPHMAWELQFFIFAIMSVASLAFWHMYLRKHPTESDQPTLNRRGQQYVGRIFTLTEPIVNGIGKIRVDDTTWKVAGNDCTLGSNVKVIAVDGVMLKIEVQ